MPIAPSGAVLTVAGMTRSTTPNGTPATMTTTVQQLPACFVLIRAWLTPREADWLRDTLRVGVPWEQTSSTIYGRTHPTPRLTCWFGSSAYSYSGIRNVPRPWPPELVQLRHRLEAVSGARYNACLANLYRGGTDTVGFHQDNERGLDPHDTIASVSLGAARDFRIREISHEHSWTVSLGHGDLLLMHGPDSQTDYEHSVPRRTRVAAERLNLTFRRYR